MWTRALPRLAPFARRAAMAGGVVPASIVFSNDRRVRRLNARFRGRDKPTNVLTFEHGGGELILAFGTIAREAAQAGRSLAAHTAHLIVHGALHLEGHDHHHPGEARVMEMREAVVLTRLGYANPWKRA